MTSDINLHASHLLSVPTATTFLRLNSENDRLFIKHNQTTAVQYPLEQRPPQNKVAPSVNPIESERLTTTKIHHMKQSITPRYSKLITVATYYKF